jgi:hypothetical protein
MKKIQSIIILMVPIMLLILHTGCQKDPGFEGKAKIHGVVNYSGGVAAASIVTIKFDATAATEAYDYSTVTDASGNYSFNRLSKGDYYVDASYTDNKGFVFHTPGYLVKIGGNKEEVHVDIALQ